MNTYSVSFHPLHSSAEGITFLNWSLQNGKGTKQKFNDKIRHFTTEFGYSENAYRCSNVQY